MLHWHSWHGFIIAKESFVSRSLSGPLDAFLCTLTFLPGTLVAKLVNNYEHVVAIFTLSSLFQGRKWASFRRCTQSSWRKTALIDCWHSWMKAHSAKGCWGWIKGFFTFNAMFLPVLACSSFCSSQKAKMQMAEPSVWNQNHAFRPEDPY